jgi:hypothetical protein
MINLNQIQEDCLGLILSAPQLATVNVVLEKKFIVDSQLEIDAIWLTVRNGRSGCGVLIEVPEIESAGNNMSGPPQNVILSFVSFQNGDAAFTPELGSGLFAEEVEQLLIDLLHLQSFATLGTIQVDGKISEAAREYPGINARRLTLKIKPRASRQTPRTAAIVCAIEDGSATLTCATEGAKIVYTLDGSFPSDPAVAIAPLSIPPAPLNAESTIYSAPFTVQSGAVIRAAAFADGFNPGEILNTTAP